MHFVSFLELELLAQVLQHWFDLACWLHHAVYGLESLVDLDFYLVFAPVVHLDLLFNCLNIASNNLIKVKLTDKS